MAKCERWHVLLYWMLDGERHKGGRREALTPPRSTYALGFFRNGYVGMSFPASFYPTTNDLPMRRRWVDVFKDLRR